MNDKTLDVVDVSDNKQKVSDVKITGNFNIFQFLCKVLFVL